MRMALFAMLALAMAPPVVLRYKHPVGQVLRYDVAQSYSVIVKAGDQPARPTGSVETDLVQERRVVSASGGSAQIRERTVSGTTTRTLPTPRMTEVVPDVQRTYTFNALGACLALKREAPIGARPALPQFLDEFSVPLPQSPVSAGGTWSGETSAVGPGGRGHIKLSFAGKVAGTEKRLGRTCLRLEIGIRGKFAVPATATGKQTTGEVVGKIVQFFDPQAGLDAETQADLTITTKGSADVGGKPVDAEWTTALKSKQTLARGGG